MLISLDVATRLSVFVFVLTTMFGMGLGLTLERILEPFRSVRLVILALVANFLLVPLTAYVITKVFPGNPTLTVVLLILGTCSGAPMLPKLVEFAKGHLALGVGMMVLLMLGTVIYVPLVLPLLLPGSHAHPWPIARLLFGTMLPPLAAGLVLRTYRKDLASRLQPIFRAASNVALALIIGLIFADKWSSGPRLWNAKVILSGTLLMVLSFAYGYLLGGPNAANRKVLALGTSARNMSATFLVAVENFKQSEVLAVLTIMVLLGLLLQIPTALALGRRASEEPQADSLGVL